MKTAARYIALVLILLLSVSIAACGKKETGRQTSTSARLQVMATVYPMYEFSRVIGGDKAEVATLVPAGVEPHDWEPTAKDLGRLKSAQVVVYNGAGLEPWLDKFRSSGSLGKSILVEASKSIPIHKAAHDEGNDPHVWLDPVAAQAEVDAIADGFATTDPQNAEYYRNNAAKLKERLVDLDKEYQEGLAAFSGRSFVATHTAFSYLAERYHIRQVAIMGLAPDAEPTPDKVAEVARFCRDNKVSVVFFETLVSPKLAATIAGETGARTMVLNPIEGLTPEEQQQGKDYFTIMRENLANLKTALGR